jgi:2-keto-4-pentenoate hydratase/2-oxohepta-3-ene-1,7-dioic acid hydratase in catechol pathway
MALQLVNFLETSAVEPRRRVGFLSDGQVVGLDRVAQACTRVHSACECADCWDSPLGIIICPSCLGAARDYQAWYEEQDAPTRGSLSLERSEARLLSPVLNPGKILCLAQNFPAHAAEASAHITHSGVTRADSMTPHVFMKPVGNTLGGDGDPIVISHTARFVDYEAELVVVIGKHCKYVKAPEAGAVIAGVTCMNDVSERRLKIWERAEGREWDKFFDWLNGKWMDSFAPVGPALVPAADVDVDDLWVHCRVNGEPRQEDNTGSMYHLASHVVEYVTHIMSLDPGDLIALGTPAGVGVVTERPLGPGDVVEVEVEGVGVLRNPVVAEG